MSYVETLHQERKARLAKIATAAQTPKIKAKPVRYDIPNVPYGERKIDPRQPPPVPQTWVDRQKDLHGHKEPWFEITDGPRVFEQTRSLKIEEIQRAVSVHFGIRRHELLSGCRTKNISVPRHVMFYLCKRLTLRSLPEIGRRTGGRDHTTVLHGVRKIAGLLKQGDDLSLCASVEMLIHQLGGDPA